MYDVHLGLNGNHVAVFLVVVIELFSLGVLLLLRRYGHNQSEIGDFAPTRSV